MQSHFVCTVSKVYNFNDTDDEKVLSENCDEINILTILTKNSCRHERSLKILNKNKNIMQECIKKKQYIILKILYHENYVNVLKAVKIQNNQKILKSDIILKINSDALSSQLIIDDIKSLFMLRNLSMSD